MAKKKHPEHVNHERWLVSYADFITLLFAFFVVMFASSQADSVKVGRFVDSFSKAIQWSVFSSESAGFLDGAPSNPSVSDNQLQTTERPKQRPKGGEFEQPRDLKGSIKKLQASAPILAGLKIEEAKGELILRLPERLVFERGKAEINPEGKIALTAIADELKGRPVKLRVEGHTDSTPIHTDRFPSNWELSTARATAVIAFFIEKKDFDPDRLSASGYAEFHPIADNDTEEGRASNRRVDLVITEVLEGIGNQYLTAKVKAEKRAENLTEPTILPREPEAPKAPGNPERAPEAQPLREVTGVTVLPSAPKAPEKAAPPPPKATAPAPEKTKAIAPTLAPEKKP
jgi:chemotaxis protein MotB